jgi:uncharacterized protein (TIGR02444 family)
VTKELMEPGENQRELWTRMCVFYERPGIAPALLELQARYAIDVPLFLAVLLGAVSGASPDEQDIAVITKQVSGWRQAVIVPLRNTREALKSFAGMMDRACVVRLREAIKKAELNAERVEVEFLETLLVRGGRTTERLSRERISGIALSVLRCSGNCSDNVLPALAASVVNEAIGLYDTPDAQG